MTNLAEASSSTAATSRLRGRSVLLAMDGSEGALAGARTADALAAQRGAIVHVVSIIDTRSVPFPPALDI
ncbi:MAG: universal stress protein, partial [Gemmatimonadaceae bacterium]|nr:universal stress protein [Gemmatimonadaceae bacterium]